MGLFGGSTKTSTSQSYDSGPSSYQQPYLDTALDSASSIYADKAGSSAYTGDLYANLSDDAKAALAASTNYANTTGLSTANQLSSIGSNLAGYSTQAGDLINNYLNSSSADAIQSAAQKYADNPYLQDQIDAAASDVTRNLSETTLPGIDRAASSGGNINSSRAGVASGIAQRGAAEDIANLSAQLRSDAYSQGLTLAQNAANSNLTAANAYSSLGSQGISALQAGTQAGYNAYSQINANNSALQADEQGQLDADKEAWDDQDSRAWDELQNYYNIVGANQWGTSGTSSGTSTTSSSGSILSSILGGASTAAGIYTALSDPRLKVDVSKVGELSDGLGVYKWRYIWEPVGAVNIGVMADEVAALRPHALGEPVNGFLTVNYSEL